MGYWEKLHAQVEVRLSGGYTAQVRGLDGDEEDEVRAQAGAGTPAWDGKRFVRLMLVAGVERWDLDDAAGKPLAVDEQAMRRLSQADRERLWAGIKDRDSLPEALKNG